MPLSEPLPLSHSWPLFERGLRFDLGHAFDPIAASEEPASFPCVGQVGLWECDLATNALAWSDGVYDIFGLPRGVAVGRTETVGLYCEASRAMMERLRAYAIKHRRGFTLDAKIRPYDGGRRWMRLIAAPICTENRVVRLHGIKQDVTHLYR